MRWEQTGVLMESRNRPERVRFVEVPGGFERAGVLFSSRFGIFLDRNGNVVQLVVDDTSAFRRMTVGMIFSKQEAKRALKGSMLRSMTSNTDRKELYHEIECSIIARRKRGSLERALADFGRPKWGICNDHLHIYLRGEVLRPIGKSSAARSLVGGTLLALRLMNEAVFQIGDAERLIKDLTADPRFAGLPVKDPPAMNLVMVIAFG